MLGKLPPCAPDFVVVRGLQEENRTEAREDHAKPCRNELVAQKLPRPDQRMQKKGTAPRLDMRQGVAGQ